VQDAIGNNSSRVCPPTDWIAPPTFLSLSLRFHDSFLTEDRFRRQLRESLVHSNHRWIESAIPVQILLVEDERKLADAVAEGLRDEGYDVVCSRTGEDALDLLREQLFDLVLLDIMLPRRSGLEVLRDIRRAGTRTQVLILTSRDAIEDRVSGLDAGADDYLVKPFAFPELLARMRALLRRTGAAVMSRLQMSDLILELQGRTASRAGQKLELTAREFDLLEYLLLNRGTVISREMLARDVWKQTTRYTPLDNVIDVQITRLRRKLDGSQRKKLLHTVRGVGFVMRESEQ
jgi:two-component system, OmpR family, copper resistance phosphate regulon response regulator CusR